MASIADIAANRDQGSVQLAGINNAANINTTGATVSLPNGAMARSAIMLVRGSAGIASGAVILEGSLDNINWFQLIAPVTAVASANTPASVATGPFLFARTRISTAIGSGTVTVDLALSED